MFVVRSMFLVSGLFCASTVFAAGGVVDSPTGVAKDSYVYYPGTEPLEQNEIRSIPAIHAGDGPVSFILEYAGLKVVIGGDTFPNKWFIKHATHADIAIHETFLTPQDLVRFYGQSPGQAIGVGTQVHTSPPAFGKVMSTIKPSMQLAITFSMKREHTTTFSKA